MSVQNQKWDWEITSRTSFWGHSLSELWAYRFLQAGLVRRQFLLNYQQTVLGPLWILFQPIITLITYMLVFHKLVGISTGALPPVLFYASGIILWNFFSDSFMGTSATFKDNAHIFSKVYFPRIIMPVSVLNTQVLRFLIQLAMFLLLVCYYVVFKGLHFPITPWLLLFPVSVLLTGVLGLGLGLLFSVLTAKYRDLTNIVSLGIRLLMFVTPVIYPLEAIANKVRWIVELNPLTPLFEMFRFSLLGKGTIAPFPIIYCGGFILILMAGSLLFFNKQGDKLIDVI
jgi:lipopolysaccharide transport system permease protein